MTTLQCAPEPTSHAIRESWRSKQHTQFARALWRHIGIGSYDRIQAHRQALRLMVTQPTCGQECCTALVNCARMVPDAVRAYHTDARERACYDAVYRAYVAWRDDVQH